MQNRLTRGNLETCALHNNKGHTVNNIEPHKEGATRNEVFPRHIHEDIVMINTDASASRHLRFNLYAHEMVSCKTVYLFSIVWLDKSVKYFLN